MWQEEFKNALNTHEDLEQFFEHSFARTNYYCVSH